MSPARGSRRGRPAVVRRYPRTARINEVLRQVLAEGIERLADRDDRLEMATVTAVECDPDQRSALVLMSSLSAEAAEALAEGRVKLQALVSREVKLRWTPQLRFEADPAVASGQRIEEILRDISSRPVATPPETGEPPG